MGDTLLSCSTFVDCLFLLAVFSQMLFPLFDVVHLNRFVERSTVNKQ